MYSQMLCLNNWNVFHNPAEKDCSPGRRCGGDCEIFLESGWTSGATRTRCPRQPIVDMDVDCRRPRHDENYSSLFVENSHPETLHRDMCIACSGSSWILPMYFTNFQVMPAPGPASGKSRLRTWHRRRLQRALHF